jgi:hypothetical protein
MNSLRQGIAEGIVALTTAFALNGPAASYPTVAPEEGTSDTACTILRENSAGPGVFEPARARGQKAPTHLPGMRRVPRAGG